MDRRHFFSSLAKAAAGATVAYSLPSIIVPKNIEDPIVHRNQTHWVIYAATDFGGPSKDSAHLVIPYIWLNVGLEQSYSMIMSGESIDSLRRRFPMPEQRIHVSLPSR